MKLYYFFAFIVLSLSLFQYTTGEGCVADWEPFKDEKCFRLLDNVDTHAAAIDLCKKVSATATLASILSKEEQVFLEDYIFKKKGALNSVWIGGKRNPQNKTVFTWDDGNRFDYSNWDKDDPHNEGDDCVQIEPQKPFYEDATKLGKWLDIQCTKKNQVLCQVPQTWNLNKLVQTFLEFRKDFKDFNVVTNNQFSSVKNNINDLNGKTQNLISNPVPMNFIYIQLPTQPEPSALWPTVKWEDVSNAYAGLFFRVLGGSSEKFGTIQAENSPRLSSVEMVESPKAARVLKVDVPVNGDVSGQVYAGSGPAATAQVLDEHLKFKLSPGEVRPRNHAVKVWKCTQ